PPPRSPRCPYTTPFRSPKRGSARAIAAAVAARLTPSPEHLRVLRGLLPYIWPGNRPDLQLAVVLSLGLMLLAKLVTVAMPFTFKDRKSTRLNSSHVKTS